MTPLQIELEVMAHYHVQANSPIICFGTRVIVSMPFVGQFMGWHHTEGAQAAGLPPFAVFKDLIDQTAYYLTPDDIMHCHLA